MKLNKLYLTHPEIFVTLTLEHQIQILHEAGLELKSLRSPLDHFKISEERHYDNTWTFSGYSSRILLETTTYIAYWNDHCRLDITR